MRVIGSVVGGLVLGAFMLASPAIARAGPTSSATEPEPRAELAEAVELDESDAKLALVLAAEPQDPEPSVRVDDDALDEPAADEADALMSTATTASCDPVPEEPPLDKGASSAMCTEVEKLLHDEVENLGKTEAQLREELAARGCHPRAADKKSTDMVRYGAYPYAAGARGYVLRRIPFWWSNPGGMRLFSGQVSAEGAYAGRDVWGASSRFRGSLWRLGVETSHSYHLDRREKSGLYHGDVHVVVAPVLRPRAVWWIGMGAVFADQRFADQEQRGGSGLSGTTSLDLFPVRPVVLSARVDAGRLGKGSFAGTHTLRARATAGIMLRRFELYGGYEAKQIGPRALHGPVAGLRTWF